jgi:hypothetical protein
MDGWVALRLLVEGRLHARSDAQANGDVAEAALEEVGVQRLDGDSIVAGPLSRAHGLSSDPTDRS